MTITVAANGLSIVHQGSGGEANATLPDVCLTTVGNAVVPIPYGNNAKSADLAGGTTTITMDGGKSVAIKGSTFSASTGDSGGDKKGVASGSIEDEAKFISASPTVKFEGAGVCRLSDQMTMNKANTMCLGGAQNPSVSVTEDEEGTYTVDVKVRYPDGVLLKDADFDITDTSGSVLSSGHLDSSGQGDVSDLGPGQIKIVVKESADDFQPNAVRADNPHYLADINDDAFFEKAAQGQQIFWQPNRITPPVEGWGVMGTSLIADRYFADIVKLEVKTHFLKHHPEFIFNIFAETIIAGIESMSDESVDSVVSSGLPMVLEEGELLSVLLRLPEHETADRMLAYMRARGKGNPQTYLQQYDWQSAQSSLFNELESLLNKVKCRIESLSLEASRLNYTYLSVDIFDTHVSTTDTYLKQLSDNLSSAFERLKSKSETLMSDLSNVSVIQASDNIYSSEAGNIEAVVNAILKIDLEELKWIKIRAIHDDRWGTPLYTENLKVIVNDDVLHKSQLKLTETPQRSTVSESVELAMETQGVEGGVIVVTDLKSNASSVNIEFEGEDSIEDQIAKQQEAIETYLDGLLNTVSDGMSEFQEQWEDEGILCLGDGVIAGAKAWGADVVELFSPQAWEDMGFSLAETTTDCFDKSYIYANHKYEALKKYTSDAMNDTEEELEESGLHSWAQAVAYAASMPSVLVRSAVTDAAQTIDETIDDVKEWWDEESDDIERKIKCIARHWEAVWNLPDLFTTNDVKGIEEFVDTVLTEYDPEWAIEIKQSEFLPKVLALINDNASILPLFTYLNLIREAIPPNFYFYHVGKAAAYIAIEVVLTLVIGLLTGPAGAGARIAAVTAKFTMRIKKVGQLSHAAKALDTFIDIVDGLIDILPDYEKLANSLALRRKSGLRNRNVNGTVVYKENHDARDGKCRCCKSAKHKTPRLYRGKTNYV